MGQLSNPSAFPAAEYPPILPGSFRLENSKICDFSLYSPFHSAAARLCQSRLLLFQFKGQEVHKAISYEAEIEGTLPRDRFQRSVKYCGLPVQRYFYTGA